MSDSLQPYELQHTRLRCPSPSPRVCSNACPLISGAIQPSHPPLPPSPPALNLSQHQRLFQVSSSHLVARVLELHIQHQSFQWIFRVWLVWSPCSPRDSQQSSPAPHFKSISSLVLSLPYCPALTSMIYEIYRTIRKTIALTIWTFAKWCLCFLLWEYNFGW